MKMKSVDWILDNKDNINGHKTIVHGQPRLIDCPLGKAIEFNRQQDSIFLDINPLVDMSEFTVEVIFNPSTNGLKEQRFLHLGDVHGDRFMFEIRLTNDDLWFMDNYLCWGSSNKTLYNKDILHKTGEWTHAAAVFDGVAMRNYVAGKLELRGKLNYQAMISGKTSIGSRQNKVCWFKGAIHRIKITNLALNPQEFIETQYDIKRYNI